MERDRYTRYDVRAVFGASTFPDVTTMEKVESSDRAPSVALSGSS